MEDAQFNLQVELNYKLSIVAGNHSKTERIHGLSSDTGPKPYAAAAAVPIVLEHGVLSTPRA
jgi:hypothetical protein